MSFSTGRDHEGTSLLQIKPGRFPPAWAGGHLLLFYRHFSRDQLSQQVPVPRFVCKDLCPDLCLLITQSALRAVAYIQRKKFVRQNSGKSIWPHSRFNENSKLNTLYGKSITVLYWWLKVHRSVKWSCRHLPGQPIHMRRSPELDVFQIGQAFLFI